MKYLAFVVMLVFGGAAHAQFVSVTVGVAGNISGAPVPALGQYQTWTIPGGSYTTGSLDLAGNDTTFNVTSCDYPQGKAERHVMPGTYVANLTGTFPCLTPPQWQKQRRAELGLCPLRAPPDVAALCGL